MKYKIIKDKYGFSVKYANGKDFTFVDTSTSDTLGSTIKTWKTLNGAMNWINKNCLAGKPNIEIITNA